MSWNDIEYVPRDPEKVGRLALLELEFNLRNRLRGIGRENLALVDCHDDVGTIAVETIGRTLDLGLKNGFECLAHVVGKNSAQSRILYAGQIGLITLNGLFPLGSLEQADAAIG